MNEEKNKRKKVKGEKENRGMVVGPCVQDLAENVRRVFLKKRRNILVNPKDKLEPREGVYSIHCKHCE